MTDRGNQIELFEALLETGKVLHGDRLANRNPGYCHDAYAGGLLLLPESTAEVSAICKAASARGIALVAHGGLTGLVDGAGTSPGEVAVSFERMNGIIRVDPVQGIAVAEAGVRLEALIDAAAEHGMQPGVDLPSRGTCTLGGMAGTNAGGIQAIRYGMMRDNILGLKAVLASGEVLDLNNTLVKNNAGYDLRQMFIGSEGTLGLITELVVKLHPKPSRTETTLLGCPEPEQLPALLQMARDQFGSRLLSFEAMWPSFVAVTGAQPGMGPRALAEDHGAYGIIEIGSWDAGASDEADLEAFLAEAFEAGHIADAVIAQSEAQRAALWRLREDSDAIETKHEVALTYDVGLELADITGYISALDRAAREQLPGIETYYFGHMGDGNLHVMLGGNSADMADRERLDRVVYGVLCEFRNTTISAEHGIGLEKRPFLHLSRGAAEIAAMRQLKTCFDPRGILNPGKIL